MNFTDQIKELNKNIKILNKSIKKLNSESLFETFDKPHKVLYYNFLLGLSRGIGMAIGFTILGAIVLYILKTLVALNLPLIGNFIADLVKIVQDNLK